MRLTLVPAYGRDYKSNKEVIEDFNKGNDFVFVSLSGEAYCNREDLIKNHVKGVNIRYKKLRNLVAIEL